MVTGDWIMVASDTAIIFCRILMSLLREINSPVLVPVKKLRGRLSRWSKSLSRKSHVVRTATHPSRYELR